MWCLWLCGCLSMQYNVLPGLGEHWRQNPSTGPPWVTWPYSGASLTGLEGEELRPPKNRTHIKSQVKGQIYKIPRSQKLEAIAPVSLSPSNACDVWCCHYCGDEIFLKNNPAMHGTLAHWKPYTGHTHSAKLRSQISKVNKSTT